MTHPSDASGNKACGCTTILEKSLRRHGQGRKHQSRRKGEYTAEPSPRVSSYMGYSRMYDRCGLPAYLPGVANFRLLSRPRARRVVRISASTSANHRSGLSTTCAMYKAHGRRHVDSPIGGTPRREERRCKCAILSRLNAEDRLHDDRQERSSISVGRPNSRPWVLGGDDLGTRITSLSHVVRPQRSRGHHTTGVLLVKKAVSDCAKRCARLAAHGPPLSSGETITVSAMFRTQRVGGILSSGPVFSADECHRNQCSA